MALDSSLVRQLKSKVQENPVDVDFVKAVLCEIVGIEEEPYSSNTLELFMFFQMEQLALIKKLTNTVEEKRGIGATRLALVLKQNNKLIENFTVEPDEDGERPILKYQGSTNTILMYKAFDNLKIDLSQYIGFKEFDYKTLSHAIMMSKNFLEREEKDFIETMVDGLVVQRAYELLQGRKDKNRVTIPEIRKSFTTDLKVSTQEIERILLNAGWQIVKFGSCATKFFRPSLEITVEAANA